MTLMERFRDLTPDKKKALVWSVVGLVVLVIAVTGYNSRAKRIDIAAVKSNKVIHLDPDMIEKTMLKDQGRQIDTLKKAVNDLQKSQTDFLDIEKQKDKDEKNKKLVIPSPEQLTSQLNSQTGRKPLMDAKGKPVLDEKGNPLLQEAPVMGGRNLGPQPQGGGRGGQQKEKKIVGKIAVVSNQTAIPKDDGKKKGRTVYLPPSFMEANLLTGFDAATSSGAKGGNSEPLLLRIQTPAVLPNDIKANLSGCFVIAEAVGRLDKERADVRLVSLSCLSNEGSAVIDTPIKGFVTDSDSKVGLSGRVVSRMGAATARAIIAGIFGGAGEALKAAATTTSTSTLTGGTTSNVDAAEIGKYAIGGGLSKGSTTLEDFYMDLAKQTTPVIEVAATKKITVIVSEGKDLEIKENKRDQEL
ncbi:MAG: TraB/VirB10 family protein [Proteobacteria bacterium]|nr:conjugal transfer protein TraB [Desulfocapsa sp.]MBU3944787.1 TraB/VirB10 family protein [Pseudomonadota bacterium]MCG2742318.1 TraB/VirB10 family protein [Desulfobacteraceae bacterium]MBU4044634.1 TraB/VirB10 family protein [Pseudomonadota bacterium]MBU4106807.1 TraB/VirB10 family protein [Pseudomonadota bacterium]